MSMPVWSVVNIFKDGDTTLMPTLTVSVMSSIEFLSILQPRNFTVYLIITKSLTLLWVTSFMYWIQPTPWNWLTSWRPAEKVSSNSVNWWIFPSAQKCAKSLSCELLGPIFDIIQIKKHYHYEIKLQNSIDTAQMCAIHIPNIRLFVKFLFV